jgi:hypothetical protein
MSDWDEDEVELRRFDNAFDAELALAFVREHGVRARLKGSGTTHLLDRFTSVVDLRLVVPAGEREAGMAALEAMELGEQSSDEAAHPRLDEEELHGDVPYRERRSNRHEDAPSRKDVRYRRGAIVGVAWFGGAHLNARQSVLGWFLCVAMWTLLLAAVTTGKPWLIVTFTMLWLYDIAHGIVAVDLHNEGKRVEPKMQLLHGLVVLLVASLASMALVTARPPRRPAENTIAPMRTR